MTTAECPFESDVVAAIMTSGPRPELPAELEQHVHACRVCTDVLEIAMLLQADREAVVSRATVPSAGQVWWRAVVRARLESARSAGRPITWVQGLSAACMLGLTC